MNNSPIISIIVCLYNTKPDLFNKSILSIKNQTFNDYECLIINDGSSEYSDENNDFINKLCDSRFKWIDRPHKGKSQTLNYGFQIANGEYIAINDSDDCMFNIRLEYQYNVMLTSNLDVLYNCMETDISKIKLPAQDPSQLIQLHSVPLCNHPVMMMKKSAYDNLVKIHISQLYDSIEDNLLNYILFYSGLKMAFDNVVLETYCTQNNNALHYQANRSYYKEALYKLQHNVFSLNINNIPKLTIILLYCKDKWHNDELEKTLFNIKMTVYNVNIILYDYGEYKYNDHKLYNFKITINNNYNSYIDALSDGLSNCTTEYFMIISKPIRFYNQNWDLDLIRRFTDIYQYNLIQPYMFDIKKIDEYDYINEDGKDEYNVRTGCEIELISKNLYHKKENLDLYWEYSNLSQIPCIDDDLIFAGKTKIFSNIKLNEIIHNHYCSNVFISLIAWLTNNFIYIDTDIRCGVIYDDNVKKSTLNKNEYFENLYRFSRFFLNETQFIYDKILEENLDKNIYNAIVDNLNNDNNFYDNLNKLNFSNNISWFLKNINMRYHLWIP